MNFNVLLVLLYTLITLTTATSDEGWHLATMTPTSFHPTPRIWPHFMRINDTHAVLYGGVFERTAYNLGDNVFYNDMFILKVTNPDEIEWSKVQYNPSSPVPRPRGFECVVYSPPHNALFLYGGVTYNDTYTEFEVFADSWVFYFANSSWVQLDTAAPLGKRGGVSCDYLNGFVYLTAGSVTNFIASGNETWKWNLATNTWTKIITTGPVPPHRTEHRFRVIPGTTKLLLVGGEGFNPPAFVAIVRKDIWVFETTTSTWTQLTTDDVPDPYPEVFGIAVTSSKWVLIQGGDAQGNLTIADTCKPPLLCVIPATPTDDNYWIELDLKPTQNEADWDEEFFDNNLPPLKRSVIVIFPKLRRLYLVGGHGWDGQHGVGEIYNQYTWRIDLSRRYFT